MSTKITLSHNKDYRLYEECFDKKDTVYLQIDNPSMLKLDLQQIKKLHSKTYQGSVTVSISIETWRHIVECWLKTQWAQNLDWDYDENCGDYK